MHKQNEKFNKEIATVKTTKTNCSRNLSVENTTEVKASKESYNNRLNHVEVKYNSIAL